MKIKISQIKLLFSLFLLVSCNNSKNEEIQKLKKQKAQIGTKLNDCENKVSNAAKSDQLESLTTKYQSLIDEAMNFNIICKRSHFENDIQLFDLKKLNEELRDFNLQFEKMAMYEEQQNMTAKTKHICFEVKENIMDVEGNIYRTVKIGSQHWMAENLKTKWFNNSDEIVEANSSQLWNTTYYYQPKLCFSDESIYYDGNVVIDSRNVCPTGWHIPSEKEWMKLVDYLGGKDLAGISMKDCYSWKRTDGYSDYKYPKGTNKSGFETLAVGYMSAGGNINEKGERSGFWSSTQTNDHFPNNGGIYYPNVWAFLLNYRGEEIWRKSENKNTGLSIRCIED
jgi:uncharacterized protein (TIGR02145 family)